MSEETKSQFPEPAHPKTSKCKYCKQEIPRKALKCHHCGEYQNRSRLLAFLPLFMLIIAAIQVLLGYIQTLETHKKYIDASDTLNKVEKTERDVNYLSKNIEKKVAEINNILDETKMKLAVLDRSIQDGNKAVTELKLLTRFNTVVVNAQNNDREAYDQLEIWTNDNSFPFQKNALYAMNKILDESFFYFLQWSKPTYKVPWKEGVDPNKVTLSQLRETYNSASDRTQLGIIQFLWEERGDIPKKERLQFLADVLKNDKNLDVCKLAGHYFKEGTKDGFVPLAIKPHLEWWEKNKETIK
jgi:uncharacterized protein YoxC